MKKPFAILGLALATTFAGAAQATSIRMEAASPASQSGTISQTLAQYTAKEGIDLQVVLGQAFTRSAMKVAAGQIDSTFVVPSLVEAMRRGAGPYAGHAEQAKAMAQDVRAIFGLPGGVFHVITWADTGIESLEDVRGKRVYVGPPAGAAAPMINGIIEASTGLKPGNDYETVRVPWSAATQAFQDGQFDVLVLSAPLGQQSLNELSLQRPIRLLGIPAEVQESEAWQAYTQENHTVLATIPAGTYEGQVNSDEDVLASANIIYLAVHRTMADDTARGLAKAYWDNLEAIKRANALLRSVDTEDPFIGVNVPLHPGAAAYFRDAGVTIPEALQGE